MKRADRVHVTTAEIPLPENSESHWQTAYDGDRFLPYHTLAKFKRAVEAAEYERSKRRRERNELWVKYFTALAATVAALASVYTAFFKK